MKRKRDAIKSETTESQSSNQKMIGTSRLEEK